MFPAASALRPPSVFSERFRMDIRLYLKRKVRVLISRGAESESESESPGVVATNKESESESIKLPQLRLRDVLLESVI